MVRTIDRYIIREVIPPFLLSLLILTFLLVLPPVMEHLEKLLAKGVSWTTAARIIWTAVPQAAGLTIPMSLLVGLLVGLGRLSADREAVALLACGVSPYRLLRPVGLMGLVAGAATLYVMLVSIPDANQTFRELTFEVISKRIDSDLHPRVFFQDFPGWVLYARDEPDPGVPGWKDLLVTKTDEASGTRTIYLSRRGRMVINRAEHQVHLVLENGNQYSITKDGQADTFNFPGAFVLALNPDQIFPDINIQRGPNEKTIPELQADMRDKIKNGISPHPEIITIQQKFSIPVACLVFALVGLALGMSVARDGKLAGFVVGIAVIFAYYIVFLLAESLTKGYYANPEAVKTGGRFMAAHLARWMPNITLGLFGLAALIWRARYTEGGLPLRVPDAVRRRFDSWRQSRQMAAPAGDSKRAPRPGKRPVVVIRIPHLSVPAPRLIDRYISRVYLRIVGLSFMALLGLFYISTFIDKSDKIFKGQATTGHSRVAARLHDPAVRLLRDSDRGVAERAGDVRGAVQEQRADGDEGLRREPLSRRRLGRPAVAGFQRDPVRARAEGAGKSESPRRRPGRPDPRTGAPPVRHHEPAVGRRARRQRLPLQLLQPGAGRDDRTRDLPAGPANVDAVERDVRRARLLEARLAGVVRMGTGLQVESARYGRLSRSGRSKVWRRQTTSRPSSRWLT